ncbi:hypothetical protein H8E06_00125 [bacterium]|nr:hypothetical protein [bacterium]
MKDRDQKLIWESYLTELVGDPDDQRHGAFSARNVDADNRAAELRGPDPNTPKHGQSDANASDYDSRDDHQNKLRKAVQDLEDIPTNYTWSWTDDGGAMDWLIKRLDFTNTSEWDGSDSSIPEDLQQWHNKDKNEVIEYLKYNILLALYKTSDSPEAYVVPGGGVNPTELGELTVKGIFGNGDKIRRFYTLWKGKRSASAANEPSASSVYGGDDNMDRGRGLGT